jgi:hypothetical protein
MARAAVRGSPASGRNLIYLILGSIAILALAVVIVIAVLNRNSPFKIYVQDGDKRIGFEFEQNTNLSEALDRFLSKKAENSTDLETQIHLINGVLAAYHYFAIPSVEAADEIRKIRETSDAVKNQEARAFITSIRNTLYNLEGPFSQPNTLLGIKHARLLDAFDDLKKSDPNNRLLETIWEGILESRSFLKMRVIKNVSAQVDSTLKEGIARTCSGSFLLGKSTVITSAETGAEGTSPIEVFINERMRCPNSVSPSAQDLIKGEGTIIQISPEDMQQLRGKVAPALSLAVTVVPIPK